MTDDKLETKIIVCPLEHFEDVMALASDSPSLHTHLPLHHATLNIWQHERAEDIGLSGDEMKTAVIHTPEDVPNLATRLSHLSSVLRSRFERIGRVEDLEDAIRASRRAVDLTPSVIRIWRPT
jgi:hypothetical protein